MRFDARRPPRRVAVMLLAACLATPASANEATGRYGMVSSASAYATDAGVAALKSGGNAVDAAVTTALTLGVVMGYHSGIGGGCFMLVHTKDGRTFAFDGREAAPTAATAGMFVKGGRGDPRLSQVGALAVGVPGSLAVYDHAVKRLGRKTLADALAPGEAYARDGMAVVPSYASAVNDVAGDLAAFPASAAVFLPGGRPPAVGTVLRQPDLAATYHNIGVHGISYFYHNGFPQRVEAWMRANGGVLTAADFAAYRMKEREPVSTTYRGRTVLGFPPPSSGGVHVAQILNVLQTFDVARLQKDNAATRAHVTAEAMKLAFADRAFWLGDPDFVKVPKGLVDAAYAAGLAKKIDPTKAGRYAHGTPPDAGTDVFGKHTTHVSVADADGNWVALTATVNTYFGSKVVVPGTGVVLNNQMDDFSLPGGVANAFGLVGGEANVPAPGKRPLSSMSPTIVLKDGRPFLAVGAAGGPTIITQVVQVLSNVIDLGDDLNAAVSRPRLHHQGSPDTLRIEDTFPPAVLDALRTTGHDLDVRKPAGATNAVMRSPDGTFVGVSEPRSDHAKAGGY